MIEINLVPDVKQELIRAERTRALVVTGSIFAGLIGLGIVVLLALYVYGVQTVRSAFADDAIEKQSAQLTAVEDLSKVLTIQNQLEQIETLNQGRKADSRIFDMLAAVLPPSPNQVQISSLTMDAEAKSLRIEGQTPTYDTLEIFKKTIDGAVVTYLPEGSEEEMSDKLASDISISDVSFAEDANGAKVVRFTIAYTYPDSLFATQTPSIVIKLTNAGNVTDSYLGVPRSIFVERTVN